MDNKKLISVGDFSPEELRKWQMKLLEILVYFRDFCEAHDLRFFLASGTCLGAVRHKGFIPWDDDVDVQMPRDDYERLIRIWNKEADTTRFVCSVSDENYCSRFPMATIRSVNTTCIYDHSVNDDICQGLKIDIEYLDGTPKSSFWKKIVKMEARFMALLRAERVPARESWVLKVVSKTVLTIFPTHSIRWKVSRLLEKRVTRFKFDKDVEYVRYLGCSLKPRKCFDDVAYFDFEGYRMPVPSGYHEFLTQAYGDYMKLPPEEKRKPVTSNLVFYDLDHSYLDYKGKYYCVNNR